MSAAISSRKIAAIGESLVLTIAAITTVLMLGWLLWRCSYGFDFTDEGFYLNWISNPFIYQVSVTQFGFIYHPLYLLVGGDVGLLRQSNLILMFGLAWALCLVLLHTAYCHKNHGLSLSWNNPRLVIVSAVLASTAMTSLVFSELWLPTPSYNTLAFSALLVASIGVLLADKEATRLSIAGWIVIGIAGWLAFMAKPTTAAALGVMVAAYLLVAGKFSIRGLLLSVVAAATFLACTAWAIDGAISVFIKRLSEAAELAAVMGGKHTLAEALRWDSFAFTHREKMEFGFAALFMFIVTLLASSDRTAPRILSVGLMVLVAGTVWLIVAEIYFPALSRTKLHGMQVWAATIGALLAVIFIFKQRFLAAITRRDIALALYFAMLPQVYAFGTGSNYWVGASTAGFFWALSGIALLCALFATNVAWRIILRVAIGAQAIVVLLLYIAMENPYRQNQPLRLNVSTFKVGPSESQLVMSQDSVIYLARLKQAAMEAGFKPGTPMIDMTGHSPGSLYALGAEAIGQAWTIGGYSGSEQQAAHYLDRVPCQQLAAAWILAEPDGPRNLSPQMLSRYGMDLQNDYIQVARLNSPLAGNNVSYEQVLYRPTNNAFKAEAACIHSRKAS